MLLSSLLLLYCVLWSRLAIFLANRQFMIHHPSWCVLISSCHHPFICICPTRSLFFLRSAICACFIHVVCTWAVYSASTSKITDMSLHVILYPIAFQQDIIFYDFLWLGLLYSFVLWTTLFLLGGNAVLGVSGFLWVGAFALIILLLTAANHCLYISFLCQVIFALYGIQFGTRSLPWLCFLHCVWVFFRVHPSAFVILIKLLFQALY